MTVKKKVVVEKSTKTTVENIVSHLSNLKINLTKQIDVLSEKLIEEFQKLSDLKQESLIEQNHLEEVYGIKETANSLSALLLIQKQEVENFEEYMKERRSQFQREIEEKGVHWVKKQTDLESSYNEMKERLLKQHKRDEEEYACNLEIIRKKEERFFSKERAALEKELQETQDLMTQKEKAIEDRLKQFEGLQLQVSIFPEELARETSLASQEVAEKLKSQYNFEMMLKDKEVEGEKKILIQNIKSLESKGKEQELFIHQLTTKANDATQQVQSIACKALEVSSQRFPFNDFSQSRQERIG